MIDRALAPRKSWERHGHFTIERQEGGAWLVTGPSGLIASAPSLLEARDLVVKAGGRLYSMPPRGVLTKTTTAVKKSDWLLYGDREVEQ